MNSSKECLTKNLHGLLTLKFSKQGQELIEAIESFDLKPISDSKPEDIISIFEDEYLNMTSKDNGTSLKSNTKAVSVWFPLDDDGEPVFSIDSLKGAACYPWELDPVKNSWLMICNKKHIPLQLAQTYFYGVFQGKLDLRDLIAQTNLLSLSHRLLGVHIKYPKLRKYRFPISLDFEPKEDFKAEEYDFETIEDEEFHELIRYLYQIQVKGFTYLNDPKTYKDLYEVAVIGQNSKDTNLMLIIQGNSNNALKKTSSTVSRTFEINKKEVNVEFQFFHQIPEGIKPKDGIILSDFDEIQVKRSDILKLEAKSFVFFETSIYLADNLFYLYKEAVKDEVGELILKEFIASFI